MVKNHWVSFKFIGTADGKSWVNILFILLTLTSKLLSLFSPLLDIIQAGVPGKLNHFWSAHFKEYPSVGGSLPWLSILTRGDSSFGETRQQCPCARPQQVQDPTLTSHPFSQPLFQGKEVNTSIFSLPQHFSFFA